MKLILGKEYKRTDLHDFYNGQRQGGISTPADRDLILIFTGPMGDAFGYEDGYDENGNFHYTGEGQIGDMTFAKGSQQWWSRITHAQHTLWSYVVPIGLPFWFRYIKRGWYEH